LDVASRGAPFGNFTPVVRGGISIMAAKKKAAKKTAKKKVAKKTAKKKK